MVKLLFLNKRTPFVCLSRKIFRIAIVLFAVKNWRHLSKRFFFLIHYKNSKCDQILRIFYSSEFWHWTSSSILRYKMHYKLQLLICFYLRMCSFPLLENSNYRRDHEFEKNSETEQASISASLPGQKITESILKLITIIFENMSNKFCLVIKHRPL